MPILRIGFSDADDAMRGPASLTPMRCDKRLIRCDADARIASVSSLVVAPWFSKFVSLTDGTYSISLNRPRLSALQAREQT
ncbi:hypothetical protein PGTUg99_022858 [Puccinia graminis f. sp. tritici]|uniref:Uncharacterized protein n=1 Tax=Puccinia graminis f. sp. tritici TaxID=56615 RepID=A0A5B0LWU2_PUCGR|nr:hypothetical protein PGTUg99_022858 [Puccinia graminis f. sp. tritici]